MRKMTINDVQQVSLNILKDVHEFCVENNIRYSLCGGTLIGAMRHNGFIPWDDDVDLIMPKPDYDRFVRSYISKNGYKLFSPEVKGNEEVRLRISKVCDMKLTAVKQDYYAWTDIETGVGIDIIPAIGAPSTEREARKFIKQYLTYACLLNCYRVSLASKEFIENKRLPEKLLFLIKRLVGNCIGERSIEKIIEFQKKYDFDKAQYFCGGFRYGFGEWQPKNIFDELILHKFEDGEFLITSRYDEYLKCLFGNYMELPPEEQRVSHDFYGYYWK